MTEEHSLLARSAEEYLRKQSPLSAFRALRDSPERKSYCEDTWRTMCELGWPGILVPESYGGVDFGYRGMASIMEQQGAVLAASPLFASGALCAPLVLALASPLQKQKLMPAISSGQMTMALALEESAHHAPWTIATRAERTEQGYRISGDKCFVLDGLSADGLLVVARTSGAWDEPEGLSLFLIEGSYKGLERSVSATMDSRDVADIQFCDVLLPESALLGEMGAASESLSAVLDGARVLMAAEMLGGVQECFDRTLEYLKQREQFGVKIGSFQALKHRAAKLYVEIELARSVVEAALEALDQHSEQAPMLASLAKARVTDLYIDVTNEAVQMHGGVGVTDELDIGLFLKRARVSAQILGDANYHRERYASLSGY